MNFSPTNKLTNRIANAVCLSSFFALSTMLSPFAFGAQHIASVKTLDQQIASANENDEIILQAGRYPLNLVLAKSLTLSCKAGAILDGQHQKDTIRIQASNVTIQNCQIQNWGDNLTDMNAGIFIEKSAVKATIRNNYFKGDTFGIWADSAQQALIEKNRIEGNLNIRSQDRGNGIHLFNVSQALVRDNEVWHTRDGIYIDTSNNNQLLNNKLHDLRYGIHYMYSYSNKVIGNHTHNTRTGYALMQSKFLTVLNNTSENDGNYGILMNFITRSTIAGNHIIGTHQQQGPGGKSVISGAEGKALFIYNSQFNQIHDNKIERSDMGIHLTAGAEDNKIFGNAFIGNRQQVKYVATREQEWSHQGRGNFWSDYQGWDRNSDGIGDQPFEPNDSMDKVLWKYPAAKLLLNSPAIETLRFVEQSFPIIKSAGIKDSYPLMQVDAGAQSLATQTKEYQP